MAYYCLNPWKFDNLPADTEKDYYSWVVTHTPEELKDFIKASEKLHVTNAGLGVGYNIWNYKTHSWFCFPLRRLEFEMRNLDSSYMRMYDSNADMTNKHDYCWWFIITNKDELKQAKKELYKEDMIDDELDIGLNFWNDSGQHWENMPLDVVKNTIKK